MSVPSVALSETSPAGSQAASLGDDRIREFKKQVREIMGVDHKYDSSGQDATMGMHNKLTLIETADLGTGAVGKTLLGSETVGGKGELMYTDEDDTSVQLTSGGKLGSATTALLASTGNFAGTLAVTGVATFTAATVLAADSIDTITEIAAALKSGADATLITGTKGTSGHLAAWNADGDLVEGGISPALGAWATDQEPVAGGGSATYASDTVYLAATDGFVMAYAGGAASYDVQAYTDSSNPPTTLRGRASNGSTDAGERGTITMIVKKGEYWKAITTGDDATSIFWIPLS